MNVKTYKNEHGEIAVLVSGGYGVGWSTWNREPNLACDRRVVELFMQLTKKERLALSYGVAHLDWVRLKMIQWGYDESIHWGGFDDCHIEWVPAGKAFRITEHDGAEDLEYFNPTDWVVLN